MSKATTIQPPEGAFRGSDAHEFLGTTLEPFGFVRQTAAVKLGAEFWSLGADDFKAIRNADKDRLTDGTKLTKAERKALEEQPDEIQIYGGVYRDAAIVLWLCHQTDAMAIRARKESEHFERKIDKWADGKGIGMKGPNMAAAIKVFFEILKGLDDSTAVPDSPGNGTTEEDDEVDP